MAIIQKIHRITDLPELTNVSKAKVLVTFEGKNYIISSDLIKGKKIMSISENVSEEDGGMNIIVIKFNDGTQSNLYVYNGSQGNEGIQGFEGEKGDTGPEATINENQLRAATHNENATIENNVFKVVNDYIVSDSHSAHDKYCSQAWSAFRGKSANDNIAELNETFVTDDEYDILCRDEFIKYIVAEFTTTEDNQEAIIFSNDTNSHKQFKKFWTYEEGDVATYFVAIYGEVVTYDEQGNVVSTTTDIVRYDPVVANLWTDIYIGEDKGFFEATANQLDDIQPLYVYDANENDYVQIDINTIQEILDAETDKMVANPNYKDKDFNFYSEGLKTYIHAHYTNQRNLWDYDLVIDDEKRFYKPVYEEDYNNPIEVKDENDVVIETIYPLKRVTNYSTIDMSGFTKYYSSNDKNSEIEDITRYLETSNERCFVKNDDGDYEEIEYATLSDEDKASKLEELDENNKEYIFVEIDSKEHKYTFTYHYSEEYNLEWVRKSITEIYQNGNITLYSYFEKREYYTSEMIEVDGGTDANGNEITNYETVYNRIVIPSWIYAQYTTTYEDETALIINSIKELGTEDNTVIDITAEDYEEINDIDIIPIKYLVYEGMPIIYRKDGIDMYNEVSLDDIDITGSTIYYQITGHYEAITGAQAMSLPLTEAVYTKIDEDTYTFETAAFESNKTYYRWIETKTTITNIAEFVKNQNITIFTGIPKQLPIKFMPANATYKFATIDYDSDIVTMMEDGRICAIAEQLDENNETHTTVTITPKEGNPLVFNITVLTPASSIQMGLGEDKKNNMKINIGENTTVECVVAPLTTSNKKVTFVNNDTITITEKVEDFANNKNTTTAKVSGVKKGNTTIKAIALDGFGAEAICNIEVVKPVTNISWHQDLIKETKYNRNDIIRLTAEWYAAHPGEEPNEGDIPTTNDVKEYYMTLLKDVEYELEPKIEPEDCSYPEMQWTSSNESFATITVGNKTVIDEPENSYYASQEDVDNNVKINATGHIDEENGRLVEIGEKIIISDAVTHKEKQYIIKGLHITYLTNEGDGYTALENGERVLITGQLKDIFGEQTNRFPIEAYVIVNQSVETITVSPTSLSFNIGTTKKLTAELGPEEAIRTFEWVSDTPSVATVDRNGIVTGIAPGTAKIYANALDGSGKFATCDVAITVPVNDINFRNAINGIIYVGKGKTETINVSLVYDAVANASDESKLGVDWSTSNTSIVTIEDAGIDENGYNSCAITGVDLGAATIVAKAKDNSGTIGAIQVMVIEQVTGLAFNSELSNITMNVNDSLSLMPDFTPTNATNQVLTWTSSDETKASVNSSGIVTAISQTDKNNDVDIPVIITATTTDGSALSAECRIIIN